MDGKDCMYTKMENKISPKAMQIENDELLKNLNLEQRPNTALEFCVGGRPQEFQPMKKKSFRPQTSAVDMRPKGSSSSAASPRMHHVSPDEPARSRPRRRNARGGGKGKGTPAPLPDLPRKTAPRVHRKRAPSRELRAGVLYAGCDCVKLNGIQDDCRRRECYSWHGAPRPQCLTTTPTCGPSAYGNACHLQAIANRWLREHACVQPPPPVAAAANDANK